MLGGKLDLFAFTFNCADAADYNLNWPNAAVLCGSQPNAMLVYSEVCAIELHWT